MTWLFFYKLLNNVVYRLWHMDFRQNLLHWLTIELLDCWQSLINQELWQC